MITPFVYKLKLTGAGVEKYNGDYIRNSGGNTDFINNQNGCSITRPSTLSPIWDLQDPNFPGDEKTIYTTDLDLEYWSVNIIIPIGPIVPGDPPISQIFWKNKNLIKGDGGTGKLIGKPFLPSDLNELSLWLRADSGVNCDESNNVNLWSDQSGNSKNAISSGTERPLFIPSEINGKPCVSFDGIDDKLIGTNVISSTPAVIFAVVKFSIIEEIGVIFQQYNVYDNVTFYRGFNGGESSRFRMYNGENLESTIETNNNQPIILGCLINEQNSKLFYNGQEISTISTGPVNTDVGDLTIEGNYYLGYWKGGEAARTVKISEIIIYNRALSQKEYQKVQTYLNKKYKIY